MVSGLLLAAALGTWPQIFLEDLLEEAPRATVVAPSSIVRTVTVGDVLAEERVERTLSGASLSQDVPMPAATKTDATIKASEILYRIESSGAFKACSENAHPRRGPPCLIDDDGDGKFDRAAKNSVTKGQPLPAPVPYKRLSQLKQDGGTPSFQRLLYYQGVSAGDLRVSYREFSDGIARPAFSQELNIPLSTTFPQKIAVKGVRITILSVDGEGLKYMIEPSSAFTP